MIRWMRKLWTPLLVSLALATPALPAAERCDMADAMHPGDSHEVDHRADHDHLHEDCDRAGSEPGSAGPPAPAETAAGEHSEPGGHCVDDCALVCAAAGAQTSLVAEHPTMNHRPPDDNPPHGYRLVSGLFPAGLYRPPRPLTA